jgi:hypothetical protein
MISLRHLITTRTSTPARRIPEPVEDWMPEHLKVVYRRRPLPGNRSDLG